MNYQFTCLIAACLALGACARPVVASPTPHATVEILVDGVPQPHYAHRGRLYVEAWKGREYAIRLHNPYAVRVAVALSVDGLNTIDARETTAVGARKWVLGPYQTVTISGWQTSQTEARRFEFTTEAQSYGQALGKTANLGTISAAFFRERAPEIASDASNEVHESLRRAERSAPAEQQAAPEAAPPAQDAASAAGETRQARKVPEEYAATGMGRRTDHAITQVWLDVEDAPAETVDVRYEFRPQLVRLGVLRAAPQDNPLQRRERARGFEPGFSPEPPRPH
jgi:hypothetical protein